MTHDIEKNMREMSEHLEYMMRMEKPNCDFLLASVVQDSLLYNLNHHAGGEGLQHVSYLAARVVVQAAIKTMHMNEFTICEAIRGVMHSMVTLGGDPSVVAIEIAKGALDGVRQGADSADIAGCVAAIVAGITRAAEDLGVDGTTVERAAQHVLN